MRHLFLLSIISMGLAFLSSCSCGGPKYKETPVDKLIKQMKDEKSFSIILEDMDVDEGIFSDTYYHKYKILTEKGDEITEKTTDKIKVSKAFFWRNENYLGMELASKSEDGKVSKVPSPPGYNSYVGNSRYGSWNGGVWIFYSRYSYMSPMLGMDHSRRVYRNHYSTYSSVYRGSRPYYGSNVSNPQYGTNSAYNKSKRPDFFSRRANKSGWSSSSSSARRSRASARGTSRYNSSRSYRSSGGGFGK
ncbi:MAG: hypothetical protein GY827_00830 [Cytophagales bacterium]|nr:hypothetical protein [Cytophagales bacterium]